MKRLREACNRFFSDHFRGFPPFTLVLSGLSVDLGPRGSFVVLKLDRYLPDPLFSENAIDPVVRVFGTFPPATLGPDSLWEEYPILGNLYFDLVTIDVDSGIELERRGPLNRRYAEHLQRSIPAMYRGAANVANELQPSKGLGL